MLPIDQIAAARVPPVHMPPAVAERVVLIVNVVIALVVERAVRIVHPVSGRREMKDRARGVGVRLGYRLLQVRHGADDRVVEVDVNPRSIAHDDLIDVDMTPAPRVLIDDFNPGLLPEQGEQVPGMPA